MNVFREALLARRPTLGSWIQVNSPASAEILANIGFDWIGIDMEHTDVDVSCLIDLLRGMHGRGVTPLARVTTNELMAIRRPLDMGASGVLIPLVSTAEDAQRAVAAAKFPPQGVRGFSFCRANDWGIDFDAYAAAANDDIAVIAMIETREGVENIDAIMAVDGIDGTLIGPYDMSGSYGIPGQTQHQIVRDACRRVVQACDRAGKAAGLHVVRVTEETVGKALEDGFTLICLGADIVFLDEAARAARATALSVLNGH